jgi:AraC-like DNA-binding protein
MDIPYYKGSSWFDSSDETARNWDRIPIFPPNRSQLSKLPFYLWQSGTTRCKAGYIRKRTNTARNRQFAIELVTAGNIEVTQGRRRFVVEKGEIYLIQIDASTQWKTGPAGFAHKRFVTIDGALLEGMLRTTNLLYHSHIKPDSPAALCGLMKQSNQALHEGNLEKNMQLAFEILMLLGKYVRSADEHQSVRLAIDFMNAHLHDTFYNEELARAANVSVSHLNLLFRRHFGIPPLRYFIGLKTEQAKLLLANRNNTLKQIAEQLGYENAYFFSRQFKRFAGISPRAYRSDVEVKGVTRPVA